MGRYTAGIRPKYKGEINSIIVRKANKKYFRNPVEETKELESKQIASVPVTRERIKPRFISQRNRNISSKSVVNNRNFYNNFMSLLKNTFNIS